MSQIKWEGSRGKPLRVSTNSFEITRLPVKPYIQFDAFNEPGRRPNPGRKNEGPNFAKRQRIIRRLQTVTAPNNFSPKALYDGGAIMFASHELGLVGGAATFSVQMSDRPQRPGVPSRGIVEVRISRAAASVIQPSHLTDLIRGGKPTPQTATATNLLQLLIRQGPNLKYPNNGRAYFTNADTLPLSGGLELWRGFFQSVRPTLGRMLINIDTAMAAVYKSGPLIGVALDILKSRDVRALEMRDRSPQFKKLENFLKKLEVETRSGNIVRKKIIRGLVTNGGKYEFTSDDGSMKTVEQYFHETHNTRLQFPSVFGIVVTPKNADRQIIYPAECCEVLRGQLFKKKIPEELYTKQALDFATMKPSARLDLIRNGVSGRSSGAGPATDTGVDGGRLQPPVEEHKVSQDIIDSGMNIAPSPIAIVGRVLDTPRMLFGRNVNLQPKAGAWNVVRQILKEPKTLGTWAVVNCIPNLPLTIAERFANNIRDCCRTLGMSVNDCGCIHNCHGSAIEKALEQAGMTAYNVAQKPPQLIIVILPQSAADIRSRVKRWGDVTKGVATQCVRENKIFSRGGYAANDQYCNNVAIKINSRLGGDNFVASTSVIESLKQQGPFMIVGADVAHPGPGVGNRPSVASVVASWDKYVSRYVAFSRVQHPRHEIITDLKDMMKDSIECFGQKNKQPPRRIFFYRDGVSEGELETVERDEIQAIEDAIDEVWVKRKVSGSKPKITFIVVGKRHHVRFFPELHDADRSGNCPAGFVVDKGLSSAIARDFFLQSHGGLLGTSRPSHYLVLKDDNFNFIVDELQELSFALCHVYAKATRSVSIPAPVYYADLVCARANFYFNEDLRFADDSTTASGAPEFNLQEWQAGYARIHAGMQETMFFL